jgi:predicted nucleic acid-binding protein
VALVELSSHVLRRAVEPFPARVRTLDALHVATAAHLAEQGRPPRVVSYDRRLIAAARAVGLEADEPD